VGVELRPVPNGSDHDDPFHDARRVPGDVKLPPTIRLEPNTVAVLHAPDKPPLSAPKLDPFHVAILNLEEPPAVVNDPPTINTEP